MHVSDARGAPSPPIAVATADDVRDAIARHVLGGTESTRGRIPERLGPVRLRAHQLDAALRLARIIDATGGALLADEVGLGKTYAALAVAHDAARLVIVAPAALLPMWTSALERVGRPATLVSFERLSRTKVRDIGAAAPDPDFVLVDEAHHARTPTTRRYAALAALCARSRMLLVSATPVQNARRDLAAQLALFLGARAWTLADAELSRYVVRQTRADVRLEGIAPPAVATPIWIDLSTPDDCLEALLALPPPVPPSDGGDGGALLVYSLVRRWASSRAALRATLRRRLSRAAALSAVLETGRQPSTAEMAAWTYADASVQLAFAELVAPVSDQAASRGTPDIRALLDAVRHHESSVRTLLRSLDTTADPDIERSSAIRTIRTRHHDEKIVAFAESAETVEALFRMLRADAGVAMLTSRGAVVSGGALSRREALARFAPLAQGAQRARASERVDLLLATDLLSEGVNLQDASVVVHLDLPWNPARLEQRVGRASRLGSPHEIVSVYAMRPPAAAERLLEVEARLRAKLSTAGQALGVVGTILPGFDIADCRERGAAEEWTRIRAMLRRWLREHSHRRRADGIAIAAAVASSAAGFLAVLSGDSEATLLASLQAGIPSPGPRDVALAIDLAVGDEMSVDELELRRAQRVVDAWITGLAAGEVAGIDIAAAARARRRVLARIERVTARATRPVRAIVAALAADARRAAMVSLGEGSERVLAELANAPLGDESWLRAVAAFGQIHARPGSGPAGKASAKRLAALLLLQRRPDD